ncbi:MAG: undecaprenyl-diphosphate phosphatase [Candidatus Pacebacteria bacterium]|nr:undecaprenyl-diphosphate phosphatase [Candidatus Paceibacterota bacterium]
MISYFQAIVLGAVQGVTELFPISSLGHSVILPSLLGWHINQNDNLFLVFLVATHFATALALFIFFFKDWILIIKGFFRSIKEKSIKQTDTHAKLGWLIILGTLPAGILGFLLQKKIQLLIASPFYVAIFLFFNGCILYGAEMLRRKKVETSQASIDEKITKISYTQALKIGFTECLALIPGFSRTGSTLTGGLLVGLNHEEAARFSFLLATPIIFAAAILKLPDLFKSSNIHTIGPILSGSLVAMTAAYLSTRFLTQYFKTKKLTPFAIYCMVFGIGSFLLLYFR